MSSRRCSRTACKQPAVYTLTYVYRDSTAVLGPLAAYVEPHCYDLCATHADRLTVPRGWDEVRLPVDPVEQAADDLEALADAVREAAAPRSPTDPAASRDEQYSERKRHGSPAQPTTLGPAPPAGHAPH